jgi:hypothetical protein
MKTPPKETPVRMSLIGRIGFMFMYIWSKTENAKTILTLVKHNFEVNLQRAKYEYPLGLSKGDLWQYMGAYHKTQLAFLPTPWLREQYMTYAYNRIEESYTK